MGGRAANDYAGLPMAASMPRARLCNMGSWDVDLGTGRAYRIRCTGRFGIAKRSPLFSDPARIKESSWVSDLASVLANLRHPIHIDIFQPWAPMDVVVVEQSCLADFDAFLASSSKPPLRHRCGCLMNGDLFQNPVVCSFRAYLNIQYLLMARP
ncbi:hypothetical protein EDD18DRAFT_1156172 [Armillaria luteobubalina]|uniref:Uncharacterized protein n=1 Tax=Armillaria luteobubalina TaxID=153913 RepID=A0AA39Q883_9AGAR|nr:hypothetical protein EDD18DRAFT_1156172 [Armillaria luteobubalina]